MRVKRLFASILSMVMILSCVTVNSFAAAAGTLGISANKSEVNPGEEVVLTLSLGDCSSYEAEDGLRMLTFMVYLPADMEYVSSEVDGMFQTALNFGDTFLDYNASEHAVKFTTGGSMNPTAPHYIGSGATIGTITCKVKDTATETDTLEVTVENCVFFTGTAKHTMSVEGCIITVHNHDFGSDWKYDENQHWRECSCGEKIKVGDHDGQWVPTTPATCKNPGEETYTCDTCHYSTTRATAIDPTAHIDENNDKYCDLCGENICEHTYSWIENAPTCTETGEKSLVCEICGHVAETKELDALGHDYDGGVVTLEPTCTKTGVRTYTCQREGCDHSYTEELSALQHEWDFYDETDDEIIYICVHCGEMMSFANDGNTEVSVLPDGTVVIVTVLADGSVVTTARYRNGVRSTVTEDAKGNLISVIITINSSVSNEAVETGEAVALPIEAILEKYGTDVEMTIVTNCEKDVPVEIPVKDVKPGYVVVIINEDGTQTVVATTKMTENGLSFYCADGAVVKVLNKAMSFSDVNGENWYNDAVAFVSARGIMTGMTTTTFAPTETTTRAQVWTMLARLAGVDTTNTTEGNWYDVARAWAMENGISDGTGANDSITREQMVTMLYRFVGGKGVSKSIADFSDAADASDWAKAALEWAYGMGVMNGNTDGTMNPKGNATRAEMAQFFMNFIQNI